MGMHSEMFVRISREIKSRLCSGAEQLREDRWRGLVRGLRQLRIAPESVADAITEFLSMTGGRFAAGSSLQSLHEGYHKLPPTERKEVDQQYSQCLEAARRDFPHVFHVEVINVPARVADFRFAGRMGESLPSLNENQRSIAKVFGIPEEKYQREVQAKLYGEERYRLFAERFWDLVMQAGKSFPLESVDVIYDVAAGKFYCELRCDGITRRAAFDADVISEPIERGDREGILGAKEAVRVWLEEVFGRLAPTRP